MKNDEVCGVIRRLQKAKAKIDKSPFLGDEKIKSELSSLICFLSNEIPSLEIDDVNWDFEIDKMVYVDGKKAYNHCNFGKIELAGECVQLFEANWTFKYLVANPAMKDSIRKMLNCNGIEIGFGNDYKIGVIYNEKVDDNEIFLCSPKYDGYDINAVRIEFEKE